MTEDFATFKSEDGREVTLAVCPQCKKLTTTLVYEHPSYGVCESCFGWSNGEDYMNP